MATGTWIEVILYCLATIGDHGYWHVYSTRSYCVIWRSWLLVVGTVSYITQAHTAVQFRATCRREMSHPPVAMHISYCRRSTDAPWSILEIRKQFTNTEYFSSRSFHSREHGNTLKQNEPCSRMNELRFASFTTHRAATEWKVVPAWCA